MSIPITELVVILNDSKARGIELMHAHTASNGGLMVKKRLVEKIHICRSSSYQEKNRQQEVEYEFCKQNIIIINFQVQ
jgi:hypothetical protein